MLRILGEKIQDNRFLRLVRNMQAAATKARAAIERVRSECDRIEAAVRANPTGPDFDGAYLAAIRHIRDAL
jgi:hypothetical protein